MKTGSIISLPENDPQNVQKKPEIELESPKQDPTEKTWIMADILSYHNSRYEKINSEIDQNKNIPELIGEFINPELLLKV